MSRFHIREDLKGGNTCKLKFTATPEQTNGRLVVCTSAMLGSKIIEIVCVKNIENFISKG